MAWINNAGGVSLICSIALLLLNLCAASQEYTSQDLDEGSYFTNTWSVEFHEPVTDQYVNALAEKYNCFNYGKVGLLHFVFQRKINLEFIKDIKILNLINLLFYFFYE